MTRYHSSIQLWKVLKAGKPEYLNRKFYTESEDLITTTTPRIQFTTNCYRWRMTEQWNQLPQSLRENNTLNSFKKQLKTWILEQRQPIRSNHHNISLRAPSSPESTPDTTPETSPNTSLEQLNTSHLQTQQDNPTNTIHNLTTTIHTSSDPAVTQNPTENSTTNNYHTPTRQPTPHRTPPQNEGHLRPPPAPDESTNNIHLTTN